MKTCEQHGYNIIVIHDELRCPICEKLCDFENNKEQLKSILCRNDSLECELEDSEHRISILEERISKAEVKA
jgi:hypothetical protein